MSLDMCDTMTGCGDQGNCSYCCQDNLCNHGQQPMAVDDTSVTRVAEKMTEQAGILFICIDIRLISLLMKIFDFCVKYAYKLIGSCINCQVRYHREFIFSKVYNRHCHLC